MTISACTVCYLDLATGHTTCAGSTLTRMMDPFYQVCVARENVVMPSFQEG